MLKKNNTEKTKSSPKISINTLSLKESENFKYSLLNKEIQDLPKQSFGKESLSNNKGLAEEPLSTKGITNSNFNHKIDNYKKNSYFFKYSRINEYKKLGIELASPEKIRKWAERLLPTGKIVGLVLNANTLHHKTLKPLKGGLFCERIFGPTKDFRCACGKTITKRQRKQNNSYSPGLINLLTPTSKPIKRFFCKICEVEYTWALTRRYQLGYISLAFPVTHLWYSKGFSNPISLLFDIHKYDLDNIIYCSQTTSIEKSYEITEMNISSNTSLVFDSLKLKNPNDFMLSKLYTRRKIFRNENTLVKNHTQLSNISHNSIYLFKNISFILKNNKIDPSQKQSFGKVFGKDHIFQKENKDTQKRTVIESNKKSNKSYLIKRKKNITRTSFKENEIVEVSNLAKNNELLLFNSLVTPLLAIYSTKDFAPFVLWLIGTLDYKVISNQDQLNTLLTANLFKQFFSEEYNLDRQKQNNNKSTFSVNFIKDKDNITKITNTLIDLKHIYTNSLNTLDQLPLIVERKYHKYLIQLRQDIYLLPKHIFTKLNKQIYKESYMISNKFMKQLITNLQLKNTIFEPSLNTESNFENMYLINFFEKSTDISRLKYFLNKLKDVLNKKISVSEQNKDISLNLNELAIHFLFYKFKKKNIGYFENVKSYKSNINQNNNTILNNNEVLSNKNINNFSKNIKKSSPFISFYYNLYSIADDQLWENINDWNLIKSYITLNPDIMDKPIPAYSHRIPISGLSNLDYKNQDYNISNNKILNYKNTLKKYYFSKVKEKFVTNIPLMQNLNSNNIVNYQQFYKNDNLKQALPLKSAGAGIINKLLKSLSFNELKLMNQQLTILLKESRKNILSYKTKIYNNRNNYNFEINELSTNKYKKFNKKDLINFNLIQNISAKDVLVNKNQSNDNIQDVNYKKIEETKPSTFLIKEQQRSKSSNLRNDRYYGIDKWMEKHHELLRRSKIIKKFSNTNLSPKSMVLTVIPVLPPDLRPIMKMADQIATSDLNRLYQRVLYRNERLKKIVIQLSDSNSIGISNSVFKTVISDSQIQQQQNSLINNIKDTTLSLEGQNTRFRQPLNITNSLDTPLFGYEKHYAQRLLQEAVDNLIDNGRAGANSEKDAKGRALKSLSEVLKGKQGRFRQYLLGKRVDYSGRSVIVVGPKLKIHQCGLPREMAIELYLPFIIQYLIQMKYTKTVVGAKSLIAQNKELIESILDNVVRGHPIILNRAPTLHRLGFQAFQPVLVEGRAILLHPMACTAFNADFDGDQMAVHIPITIEARSEAWRLMLARNNLLSPATGEPIILPSQDMVLGCYYLTTTRKLKKQHYIGSNQYYSDLDTVLYQYYMGKLHIHSPIWLKTEKTVFTESTKKPVEIRICNFGTIQEIYMTTEYHYTSDGKLIHQYIRTTPGRILFNLIIKNI